VLRIESRIANLEKRVQPKMDKPLMMLWVGEPIPEGAMEQYNILQIGWLDER